MLYLKKIFHALYPIECADIKENWIAVGCSNGELILICCENRNLIITKQKVCDLPIQQVAFCPDNGIIAIDAGLNMHFLKGILKDGKVTVLRIFSESLKKYNLNQIPVKIISFLRKYDKHIYVYFLTKEPSKIGIICVDPDYKHINLTLRDYDKIVDFHVIPEVSGVLFTEHSIKIFDYDSLRKWIQGFYADARKCIDVPYDYKVTSGYTSLNMRYIICGALTKYSSYSLLFVRKASDVFSFDNKHLAKLDYAGKIFVFDKYLRKLALLTLDSKKIIVYEFRGDKIERIFWEPFDVPVIKIGWISDDILAAITNEDILLIDLKAKHEIETKLIMPFEKLLQQMKNSIERKDFETMFMLLDKLAVFLPWYQLYIISKQFSEDEMKKVLTEMKIPFLKEIESMLHELFRESRKLPEYEQKTISKFLEYTKRILKTPLSADTLATSIPGIISLLGKIGLFAKPEFMLPAHMIGYLLRYVLTKLRKKEE